MSLLWLSMTWRQRYLAQNYFLSITSLIWTLALHLLFCCFVELGETFTVKGNKYTHTHKHTHTAFKIRYTNYKKTFNNIKHQTDPELSNEYWNIIAADKTSNISWNILGTHKSYNKSSKLCFLCLYEKLAIEVISNAGKETNTY